MAIVSAATIGTGYRDAKTLETTIRCDQAIAVGDLVIVAVAKDNTATIDGSTSEVTGITDSSGLNTYTKLAEHTNGQGAVGAGATASLWMCRVAAAIAKYAIITVAHDAVPLVAVTAWRFTCAADKYIALASTIVTGVADGAALPSLASATLPSAEYLFLRASAQEGGNNPTGSASWTLLSDKQSNDIRVSGEWRILTGTAATSAPGSSGTSDNASVLVVLAERTPYNQMLWGAL